VCLSGFRHAFVDIFVFLWASVAGKGKSVKTLLLDCTADIFVKALYSIKTFSCFGLWSAFSYIQIDIASSTVIVVATGSRGGIPFQKW